MLKRAVASAVRSAAAPMRTSSTGTTTSTAAFTGVKRLTPAFTSNSSGIMGMGGSTPSSQWSWMAPAVQRSYFIRHTVAPLQDASKDAEAAAEEASATADAAAGADAGADAAEAGASGDGSSSSGGDRSPLEEAEERIQTLEAQNKVRRLWLCGVHVLGFFPHTIHSAPLCIAGACRHSVAHASRDGECARHCTQGCGQRQKVCHKVVCKANVECGGQLGARLAVSARRSSHVRERGACVALCVCIGVCTLYGRVCVCVCVWMCLSI